MALPCAELRTLNSQYDSALRVWGEYEFGLNGNLIKSMLPAEAAQLKHEARLKRDIAGWHLADHKERCPLCTAVRRRLGSAQRVRRGETCARDLFPLNGVGVAQVSWAFGTPARQCARSERYAVRQEWIFFATSVSSR